MSVQRLVITATALTLERAMSVGAARGIQAMATSAEVTETTHNTYMCLLTLALATPL